MLARQVIARALKPAAQLSTSTLRQPHQNTLATPAFRTYAKYKNHPKIAATTDAAPKQPLDSSTGPARQTSPGTSLPRDKTWKPKDSIKFGGPAAAAGTEATGRVSGTGAQDSASDTAEYNTEATPSANTVADGQPGPTPDAPHPGEPTPSTVRDQGAANVEFEGPQDPEANTEPLQPLPDLRQGIPSTFDSEYGFGRHPKVDEAAQEGQDGFGVASGGVPPSGSRPRRGDDGPEYEQKDY